MNDTKYQINILKCPICRVKTYVSVHGYEKNRRLRIYKCKRKSNHSYSCILYFSDSQKDGIFDIKDIILVRCDKCNKSKYVRLYGSPKGNRFSCVNPDCKEGKKRYIFTQRDISNIQSLKKHIEEVSPDSELFDKLKKVNSSTKDDEKKDLLQKCFDLGLQAKDIAEIFSTNSVSISRWKKKYQIMSDTTTKVIFVETKNKRKNIFMRKVKIQN